MSKWVVLILRSAKYVWASLLCSANIIRYSGMPSQQLSADTATLLKPHYAAHISVKMCLYTPCRRQLWRPCLRVCLSQVSCGQRDLYWVLLLTYHCPCPDLLPLLLFLRLSTACLSTTMPCMCLLHSSGLGLCVGRCQFCRWVVLAVPSDTVRQMLCWAQSLQA